MCKHSAKHFLKFLTILLTVLYTLAGCSAMEDKLPDSNYLTDNITENTEEYTDNETALPETTGITSYESDPLISRAGTPVSSDTTSSSAESLTETATTAASVNETAAETTPPTATVSADTAEITTVFLPGPLPDREALTEAPVTVQTKPQITVVTVPKISQTVPTTGETSFSDSGYYPRSSYYTMNFDRQKAMWISYLEYERIMKNSTEEEFTNALNICFDNIAALGCNTVYFQVRAYGDAYYKSSLFPKGDRLTGDYDPLEIAVRSAHDRGLSIHAWINPMRLMTDPEMKEVSASYKIGEWYADPVKNGTYMLNSSGRWYLNPAYGEVVSLICDGISEIVTGYNVDGVQIDDYFYPTTDPSFDKAAFESSGTELELADWRRENITKMIRRMYSAVHSANSEAVFGISPQGSVDNNYSQLYADIYTWCSHSGCCDYICPQIYFGFENEVLPYSETVKKWSELVTCPDVDLVIGLAAYKSGTVDNYAGSGSNEWINNTDILVRQRGITDQISAGYAYFRYDSLFLPAPSVSAYVDAERKKLTEQ